jgi:hypothetical protein
VRGRPKSVPDENAFSATAVGLTRKQVHEARKIRDAEERPPSWRRLCSSRADGAYRLPRTLLKINAPFLFTLGGKANTEVPYLFFSSLLRALAIAHQRKHERLPFGI